jgi:transcriptional regulator with XRE-family HTH domain
MAGRVAAPWRLSGYDVSVTDEEMMYSLGLLVKEARKAKGHHGKQAAAEIGIANSTLRFLEGGSSGRMPTKSTLRSIEIYCGWREDSMREAWDKRREIAFGDFGAEMLEPPKPKGLIKASHLTDAELMAELNFRFLMRDNREPFDG